MEDNHSAKIEKLRKIGDRAVRVFIGSVIAVFVIALVGGFLVGVIGGILGHKEWIRFVFALSGFTGAIAAFSCGLACIMNFWINAIELRSQLITLREGISGFIAYGFAVLFCIFFGCAIVWYWGIPCLIDPEIFLK